MIIVKLMTDDGPGRMTGLVVDEISDVLRLNDRHAVTTADSAVQVPTGHVKSLPRDQGDTVILLLHPRLLDFRDP